MALVLGGASRSDGVVTTAELGDHGVSRREIEALVDAGLLCREAGGVLRVAAFPTSWCQSLRLALAAAGPGAVVSHRSAALLWELDGISRAPAEVTIPRWSGQDHHGLLVHRSTDLAPHHVTEVTGLPVTEPTRTLVDLAGVVDRHRLESAFDDAVRRGLTSTASARGLLEAIARRGRRGVGPFRAMLDEREAIDARTDSTFEARVRRLLHRHGLPAPEGQHSVFDARGFVGRFDMAYPAVKVAIEADSERWHMDRARFVVDRTRRNRAEAMGWRVPSFTWHHLSREPLHVVETVDRTLVAAGWDWRTDPTGRSLASGPP